jgi:hypothetical protein
MPPPSAVSIEDQIERLTHRLAAVEARLAAVEQARRARRCPTRRIAAVRDCPGLDLMAILTNLGRSLIILSGAFCFAPCKPEPGRRSSASDGPLFATCWPRQRAAAGGNRLRAISTAGPRSPSATR